MMMERFCFCKDHKKAGAGGKWSLPGGGLDHCEDPYLSIKREIREETALEVNNLKPLILFSENSADNDFIVIICYTGNTKSQIVNLNWEHDDYKWIIKNEAITFDLTKGAKFFIENFIP